MRKAPAPTLGNRPQKFINAEGVGACARPFDIGGAGRAATSRSSQREDCYLCLNSFKIIFIFALLPANLRWHVSRGANAVEANGKIRPIRVAEIDGTVGDGAVLQRRPVCAGEDVVGFDHEGDVRAGGDVETETVVLNAETSVGALGLRIPKHRGPATEGRSPSGFSRQIIHRQVGVVEEG